MFWHGTTVLAELHILTGISFFDSICEAMKQSTIQNSRITQRRLISSLKEAIQIYNGSWTGRPCFIKVSAIIFLDWLQSSSALLLRISGCTITLIRPGLKVYSKPFGISLPEPISVIGTTGTPPLAATENAPFCINTKLINPSWANVSQVILMRLLLKWIWPSTNAKISNFRSLRNGIPANKSASGILTHCTNKLHRIRAMITPVTME